MVVFGVLVFLQVPGLLFLTLVADWEWWRKFALLVVTLVWAFLGVVLFVEAHFGFKLRKLRSRAPRAG